MTNNQKIDDQKSAGAVLRWAIQAHCDAVYRHTKADAEVRANHAAKKAWAEYNPHDGVGCIGMNPYEQDTEHLNRVANSTLETQLNWAQVRDFVIRRICNLIEPQEGA